MDKESKRDVAKKLSVSRSSLYYAPRKPQKDWQLKCAMEEVLRSHPSYGPAGLPLLSM